MILLKKLLIFVIFYQIAVSLLRVVGIAGGGPAGIVSAFAGIASGILAVHMYTRHRKKSGETIEKSIQYEEGDIKFVINVLLVVALLSANWLGFVFAAAYFLYNLFAMMHSSGGGNVAKRYLILIGAAVLYGLVWWIEVNQWAEMMKHVQNYSPSVPFPAIWGQENIYRALIVGTMVWLLRREGYRFLPYID